MNDTSILLIKIPHPTAKLAVALILRAKMKQGRKFAPAKPGKL
jgi:hypothetical protein